MSDQSKILVLSQDDLHGVLTELKTMIASLDGSNDPFADLVPEVEFSKKMQVSASTLRQWRKDGLLKECWIKKGKHIWWSPRKFREEIINT